MVFLKGCRSVIQHPVGFPTAQRATYHPPGVAGKVARKSSHTSWPSDSTGRNKVRDFTSSVFMTVGVADTLWHPQFFRCLHFRISRLTEDSVTARNVRIGEPRGPVLRSSTRLLFVHQVALTQACHCLGQFRAANMIRTSRTVFRLTALNAAIIDVRRGSSLSSMRQNWTLGHFDPGTLVLWPVTRRTTRILSSSVFDVFSNFPGQ